MIIEVIKCDSCGKATEDIYHEIGWIHFEGVSYISISGGRKKDGTSDSFRYIHNQEEIHFCCLHCLIEFLYFKEGYFNSTHFDLYDKINSIDDPLRRKEVESLIKNVSGTLSKLKNVQSCVKLGKTTKKDVRKKKA